MTATPMVALRSALASRQGESHSGTPSPPSSSWSTVWGTRGGDWARAPRCRRAADDCAAGVAATVTDVRLSSLSWRASRVAAGQVSTVAFIAVMVGAYSVAAYSPSAFWSLDPAAELGDVGGYTVRQSHPDHARLADRIRPGDTGVAHGDAGTPMAGSSTRGRRTCAYGPPRRRAGCAASSGAAEGTHRPGDARHHQPQRQRDGGAGRGGAPGAGQRAGVRARGDAGDRARWSGGHERPAATSWPSCGTPTTPCLSFARRPAGTSSTSSCERVRGAGLQVTTTLTGDPRPLPPGVGLVAYRVVQEALTNVLRHAKGSSAEVVVDFAHGSVVLVVANTAATVAGRGPWCGGQRGPWTARPGRTRPRAQR